MVALFIALVLWVGPAAAGECPNLEGANASVAAQDGRARLDYIHRRMQPAAVHAQRWLWGWGLGFTALTAAQLGLVPLTEGVGGRRLLVVGAVSSGLGAVFVAAAPPRVIRDRRQLDRVQSGDPCALLADGESRMVAAAAAERFGRSWLMHGGNLLVNVAAGLVLGLGWDEWYGAWLTTVVGTVVGEVMIWTQPMDVTRALDDYRTGTWVRAPSGPSLRLVPMAHPGGAGLGVSGVW